MHGDPGYKGTAMMLTESAIAITIKSKQEEQEKQEGKEEEEEHVYGILTPASAMGPELVERLKERGMEFGLSSSS